MLDVKILVGEAIKRKLKAKNSAGIYAIYCQANEKIYIGQSLRLDKRFKEHRKKLRAKTHINNYLQSSYNKYGEEAFNFFVLEHEDNQQERLLREKYYIENIDKDRLMNLSPPLNLEYGRLPPTFINEDWRAKISKSLSGRKLTSRHKENMSKAQKNVVLRSHSSKHTLIFLEDGQILHVDTDNKSIKTTNKNCSYFDISHIEGQHLIITTKRTFLGLYELLVSNMPILKVLPPKTSYYKFPTHIKVDGVDFMFKTL